MQKSITIHQQRRADAILYAAAVLAGRDIPAEVQYLADPDIAYMYYYDGCAGDRADRRLSHLARLIREHHFNPAAGEYDDLARVYAARPVTIL